MKKRKPKRKKKMTNTEAVWARLAASYQPNKKGPPGSFERGKDMKTATYTGLDGKQFTVQYDENAPCSICGYPVIEASVGGTAVCPWCDCGKERPEKRPVHPEAFSEKDGEG